jgi:hypothetical protein
MGLLEAGDEYERRLLCSDLLSVLKRIFASSWGDRLEHILRHAILTLLAANRHSATAHTLRDIRPLLASKAFRECVASTLTDPDLKAFWQAEFPGYNSSTFAPLYNKLGLLLSSPIVRNIVAGREGKLRFADIIAGKQILIVNLASSRIGSDNAHFLGALLVSKLQIAAMQSLRFSQAERTPFTLYVDEFQHFVVSSFGVILSEAGKAGLSLVMANQFLEQLNGDLQTAILSNVGTLCSFRVSSNSGHLLEKELAGRFTSHDLVSLNRGEAVVRAGSALDSYDIKTCPPPPIVDPDIESIRNRSRDAVCRPRVEVEAELSANARRQEEQSEEGREEGVARGAAAEKKPATKKAQKGRKGSVASREEEDVTDALWEEPADDRSAVAEDEVQTSEPAETPGDTPGLEPEFYAVPDNEEERPEEPQTKGWIRKEES